MTRVLVAIAWPAAIRRHARPSGSTGACAIYGRAARPTHIAGLPRQNPAAMGAIESWDGVACADAAAAQGSLGCGGVLRCDGVCQILFVRFHCCASRARRGWWCSALPSYSGGPARVVRCCRGVSGKSGLPSGFDNARAGQCRTRGVVFLPTASLVLYTLSGSRFCCRRGCHSGVALDGVCCELHAACCVACQPVRTKLVLCRPGPAAPPTLHVASQHAVQRKMQHERLHVA